MYPVTLRANVINAIAVATIVASSRSCSVPCSDATEVLNKDIDLSTTIIPEIKPMINAGGGDSSRRYRLRLPIKTPVIVSLTDGYMSYTIYQRLWQLIFPSARRFM